MTEKPTIRVAIVDDHPVVREGLRAFLRLADDIEVVYELSDAETAFQTFRDSGIQVEVVIMDLKMPGSMDGIEAIRRLHEVRPELRLLALTSFQDNDAANAALSAGAIGYLHKDVPPELLLGGIRQAAAGRMVIEQTAWEATQTAKHSPVIESVPRTTTDTGEASDHQSNLTAGGVSPERLTEREQEVLRAITRGLSNKEIGSQLGISEKTVKVHLSHIFDKLGVFDRTQAAMLAIKTGLVEL